MFCRYFGLQHVLALASLVAFFIQVIIGSVAKTGHTFSVAVAWRKQATILFPLLRDNDWVIKNPYV